jgi:hypothetical protein
MQIKGQTNLNIGDNSHVFLVVDKLPMNYEVGTRLVRKIWI